MAEPMPRLQSAAFAFSIPAGCKYDPVEKIGLANLTCEMIQRGCGKRNSRQFIEDLEILGLDGSSNVSNSHASFGGAMPAETFLDALDIYADMLRRPHIPEEQLEDGRMVCFQEVRSIEDDLGQKTMIELKRRHFPDPLGRTCHGTMESVASLTLGDTKSFFENNYTPEGMILSVAGNVEFEKVRDHVEKILGDWQAPAREEIEISAPLGGNQHIQHDSNQTHISLAFPSVSYNNPEYFRARGVVGVLSDGMSSRLFTEVREKRGTLLLRFCFTVFAKRSRMRRLLQRDIQRASARDIECNC